MIRWEAETGGLLGSERGSWTNEKDPARGRENKPLRAVFWPLTGTHSLSPYK